MIRQLDRLALVSREISASPLTTSSQTLPSGGGGRASGIQACRPGDPRSDHPSNAGYEFKLVPGRRNSNRSDLPLPTVRTRTVRLSKPPVTVVGIQLRGSSLRYELL